MTRDVINEISVPFPLSINIPVPVPVFISFLTDDRSLEGGCELKDKTRS